MCLTKEDVMLPKRVLAFARLDDICLYGRVVLMVCISFSTTSLPLT